MKALERVTYRLPSSKDSEKPLRFNRDVRPILSNHCFRCHGRDGNARKAGVRLDVREKACWRPIRVRFRSFRASPKRASSCGGFSTPSVEVMPPPSAVKPLTEVGARAAQTVDRRRSQIRAALGVHAPGAPATAGRQTGRLAAQRDRQFHPGPAGTGGAGAVAAGRAGRRFSGGSRST